MREKLFSADEIDQHPAFQRLLDFMDRLTAETIEAAESTDAMTVTGPRQAGSEAEEAVRGLFGASGKTLDPFSNDDDDATEGFNPDMLDDDALEELPW